MREITGLLDSTEKALQDIQKEANLVSRSQRLQSLIDSFEAELMSKWNNLDNNIINVQIDQLISKYTQAQQWLLSRMLLSGQADSSVLTKGNKLYTTLIEKLKKIKAEIFPSGEEKSNAVGKCLQEFEDTWVADEQLNSQLNAIYTAEYGQTDSEETGWNQNGFESAGPNQGDSFYDDNEELYPDEDPETSFQAY